MSTRVVFLIIYPGRPNQRAHFGLWIPYEEGGNEGTKIHVVGNPMVGFSLIFNRRYIPGESALRSELVAIGSVQAQHVPKFEGEPGEYTEPAPQNSLEYTATKIQPPSASANFMAPVNDTTNRRCQEWTMDYVRRLVELGYLDEAAISIVDSRRDAPNVGIGLRPVARPQQQA